MEEPQLHHNPNPMARANCLSKLLFWWVNPILSLGYTKTLDYEDLYNVLNDDSSDKLRVELEREWEKETAKLKTSQKPSLRRAILRVIWKPYFCWLFVILLDETSKLIQPILLGQLVSYFTPNSLMSSTEAYTYGAGVVICVLISCVTNHIFYFNVYRLGMRVRIASCSLMFKKILKLSHVAMRKTTCGQIVNLMSNDVNRFDQAALFVHYFIVGPPQTIVIIGILWYMLGPACLVGFAVLIFIVPLQVWMGKLVSKLRCKTATYTDERMRLMNEIISGMRVLKMYCWEKPFGELIKTVRKQELHFVWLAKCLSSVHLCSWDASYFLMYLSFVATSSLGHALLPRFVYTCIPMIKLVTFSMLFFFYMGIRNFSESLTSCARIQTGILILFAAIKTFQLFCPPSFFRLELHYEWLLMCINVMQHSSWSSHYLTIYITLVTSALLGQALLPAFVYTCMPMVTRATISMCCYYFMAVRGASGGLTSIMRVQEFLLLDELPPKPKITQKTDGNKAVVIKDLCAKWDKELPQLTLKNISLTVSPGELLAVVGPVGAGKSSVLMTILKELPLLSGQVNVHGTVSYVAQQPWIFSASVRQNILFGQKYDKAKYNRIVQVCALKRDIEILPHKDFTLVGERGISLSGGQRARVSLARALYVDADIYILDDPLSAVDAKVGRHLFNHCINGYLKNKAIILVTHQLQYLPKAKQIIILDQGEAVGIGTFDELLESGIDFASLLQRPNNEPEEMEMPIKTVSTLDLVGISASMTNLKDQIGSLMSLCSIGNEVQDVIHIKEEERQKGYVGLYVYIEYFKAGCHFLYGMLVGLIFIISIFFYVGTDYWVARWSNQEQKRYDQIKEQKYLFSEGYNFTNITIPTVDFNYNTAVYSGLTLGVFAFSLLKAFMFYWNSIQCSQTLHNSMYQNIVRAKIAFFDENPVGRILNRFSKDMGLIDDMLPASGIDFIQCFFLTMSVVFVTGVANPWVFIPTFLMLCLFIYLRQYYVRTSRSVKRLETVARSPVFSQINASLQGISSIRAYNAQERFLEEFDNFQDIHTEAWFLFIATTRWLALRLDLLCTAFVASVIMGCIPLSSKLDAGTVGLSVTYSFTLTGMFQWFIRQSVEVENNIVSVERVLDYAKLPKEANIESEESKRPRPSWPEHGLIVAKNLGLKYSENGHFVLKNLNFAIESQEKVGIAGRTGAGKSSLISALFRMVEPQGELIIDNVDVKSIGLHDLRSKLSIIPQDPVLFKGTLRKNLDPFKEYTDEELWRALEEVQMKDAITELPNGLESKVNEGGNNFSVGQRQLICLGRAVLRQNRILIIDEATANVDVGTDALIQKTIREKFKHCTVLTIAHRLVTIMDSDRVLVLDNGEILEFDSPYNLLQDVKGYFYKMVHQSDPAEVEYLTSLAWQAAQKPKEPCPSTNNLHEPATNSLPQPNKDLTSSVASLTI